MPGDIDIDIEFVRGVSQLIIALANFFAAIIMSEKAHASRKYGGVTRIVPWPGVVGLYFFSLGVSFGLHAIFWLSGGSLFPIDSLILVAPLIFASVFAIYFIYRWSTEPSIRNEVMRE